MRIKTGPIGIKAGFSLVELLLTLVLILCLAAASVFTFTAVYQSANLDEGSDRFQSLIRFAQAEAATTGRKVRLQFVPLEDTLSVEGTEMRTIKVTWEADLLNAPGVFHEYTNKAWSEGIVNDLVGVTKVKPISATASAAPTASASTETNSDSPENVLDGYEEFPSVTFYPDGSCDSAEIVLASRNVEDERRMAVRLGGMLGTVSARTMSSEEQEKMETNPDEAAFEEYNELFETSAPSLPIPEFESAGTPVASFSNAVK